MDRKPAHVAYTFFISYRGNRYSNKISFMSDGQTGRKLTSVENRFMTNKIRRMKTWPNTAIKIWDALDMACVSIPTLWRYCIAIGSDVLKRRLVRSWGYRSLPRYARYVTRRRRGVRVLARASCANRRGQTLWRQRRQHEHSDADSSRWCRVNIYSRVAAGVGSSGLSGSTPKQKKRRVRKNYA